jgi:hypothetical protein
MSFLDNLENNLKALENRDERDTGRDRAAREAQKAEQQKIAPAAEALRKAPFTGDLLAACRALGHARRVMVRPTWIETTFRLEAGPRRLELQAAADGVYAVFLENGEEASREILDLGGNAQKLAERWLG